MTGLPLRLVEPFRELRDLKVRREPALPSIETILDVSGTVGFWPSWSVRADGQFAFGRNVEVEPVLVDHGLGPVGRADRRKSC